MSSNNHKPLSDFPSYCQSEMMKRAGQLKEMLSSRRTVRDFSERQVPRQIIEDCVMTAGLAPSGANMQPWHFEIVGSPEVKKEIRLAAEKEERDFYGGRASQEWLDALAPLGTDDQKPFLEKAPWLIAIFEQRHGIV